MTRSLWAALAAALLLGTANFAPAQTASTAGLKPVLTVSIAGYGKVHSDVETIGKLGGKPELANMLEGILAMVTQGKGVTGLGIDKARPWGAVAYADAAGKFPVYGFIPTNDVKQLLALLAPPPLTPDAQGVYKVLVKTTTLYVVQKGAWAFVSNNPENLAKLPADPAALLGDLTTRFTVAVRASVKNVPAAMRDQAIAGFEMGLQMQMAQRPNESDDEYAVRQNLSRQSLEKAKVLINELDEVLLGWGVDATTGAMHLDFEMTAQSGTKTARQFAQMKGATTDFAGLALPGAAVVANWTGTIDETDAAQMKVALGGIRKKALKDLDGNSDLTPEQIAVAKALLGDVADVAAKTIDGKKIDGGLALLLDNATPTPAPTLALASVVADGEKLNSVVKRLVAEAGKDDPNIAKLFTLDAEKHQGVSIHTAALPVTDEAAAKVLGSTLNVALGIGDTGLYLAAGRDALKTIKQVIGDSKANAGKKAAPLEITVSATPIAKFAAQAGGGNPMAGAVVAMLARSAGKDHLTLKAKSIPNGTSVRLEIEEGLLKVILNFAQPGAMGTGPTPRPAPAPAPAGGDPFK
ncbi:MAG: hypothetical protein ABSG68_07430 [Thermoguttaceae bacterium]